MTDCSDTPPVEANARSLERGEVVLLGLHELVDDVVAHQRNEHRVVQAEQQSAIEVSEPNHEGWVSQ